MLWFLIGLVGYALLVYCTSLVKVNKEHIKGEIEVYILSNGVHTDVVVPVKTDVIDGTVFSIQLGLRTIVVKPSTLLLVGAIEGFILRPPHGPISSSAQLLKRLFF